MKRVSCAAVLALMIAAEPFANQAPDTFTVYGTGTASCASWTEHLKDRTLHDLDLQWVLGFVSAAGVFAGVQLKVGPDDIGPFITKHCQDNPANTITTAAATLVGKMRQ